MRKLTILLCLILLANFSCQKSEIENEESDFQERKSTSVDAKRKANNNSWIQLGQLELQDESGTTDAFVISTSAPHILNVESQHLLLNVNALKSSDTNQHVLVSSNANEQSTGLMLVLNEIWEITQESENEGIFELVLEQEQGRVFLIRNNDGALELVLEQGQGKLGNDGILDIVLEQGHDSVILDGIQDFIIIETLEED